MRFLRANDLVKFYFVVYCQRFVVGEGVKISTKMKKIALSCIIACTFGALSLRAAIPFVNLTIDEKLSNNCVWSIIQDREGYMWFGTKDGLNRYDGVDFRTFRKAPEDTLSLGDNFVRSLFEPQKADQIWVGTESGVYIYDKRTENFHRFNVKTSEGLGIDRQVNSIAQAPDGQIWLAVGGKGIFRYDGSRLFFYGIPSERLYHVWSIIAEDGVWCTTLNGGIVRYDKATDSFQFIPTPSENTQINSISLDRYSERLLLGTTDDGLLQYDIGSGTWSTILSEYNDLKIKNIHSISPLSPSTVMLGSDTGILLIEAGQTRMLDCSRYTSGDNAAIFSVCQDAEGGHWFGTYFYGILYLRPNYQAVEHFFAYPSSSGGGKSIVSCFAPHGPQSAWVGTNNHGLVLYDGAEGLVKPFPRPLLSPNIKNLFDDGTYLWVGYYNGGIQRYRYYGESLWPYDSLLSGSTVYSILKTHSGDYYIGTQNGLEHFDLLTHVITHQDWPGPSVRVYEVLEDVAGLLWVATSGQGVLCRNPLSGKVSTYTMEEGLPSDKVLSLCFDLEGKLWIGTSTGLAVLDRDERTVRVISDEHLSAAINSLQVDQMGYIWASTNNGLGRVDPHTFSVRAFSKNDGLQSNQFSEKAGCVLPDGRLLFGGVNGFNVLNPSLVDNVSDYPPSLSLTFSQPIFGENTLTLKHNESKLSFDACVLSYFSPENNVCEYRLDGVDDDWALGYGKQSIRYNLTPGHYTLHVRGRSSAGVGVSASRDLDIVVRPPFYSSQLAILLYIVFGLALAGYILMASLTHIRSRNQNELLQVRLAKDKELYDSKIAFFTHLVDEIVSPLRSLRESIDSLKAGSSPSDNAISQLEYSSGKLSQLMTHLSDFKKVSSGTFEFSFSPCDIHALIRSACDGLASDCKSRGIRLETDIPSGPLTVRIDPNAIQKLLSNFFSNALKFTGDLIRVAVSSDSGTLKISISNNGKPIDDRYKRNIFTPFFQIDGSAEGTGVGLSISNYIVEGHNGRIETAYVDGLTTFTIILPIIKAEKPRISVNATTDSAPSPRTILFVDSSRQQLEFVSEKLATAYNVRTAANATEALGILGKNLVDLVVVDLILDDMSGLSLCGLIRKGPTTCHIPVILSSSNDDESARNEAMSAGADSLIVKPYSIDSLKASMNSLIKNRAIIKELYSGSPFIPVQDLARSDKDIAFMNKVNAIIASNLSVSENILDLLSEGLHTSKANLRKRLGAISKMPPLKYIQYVKLRKAAELLVSTDLRVGEVASKVGFITPSYFSKCFFAQFGVLPKDFAEKTVSPKA